MPSSTESISIPCYAEASLNRIRLEDLRLVVAKYFEFQCREPIIDGRTVARLTPENRRRWRKYSLAELLTGSVYTPVDTIDVVLRLGGIERWSGGRPGHHDALSRNARGEVAGRGKRVGQRNANLVGESGAAARRV